MTDCSDSIADALELLQPCTKPSKWLYYDVPGYENVYATSKQKVFLSCDNASDKTVLRIWFIPWCLLFLRSLGITTTVTLPESQGVSNHWQLHCLCNRHSWQQQRKDQSSALVTLCANACWLPDKESLIRKVLSYHDAIMMHNENIDNTGKPVFN